MRYGLPYQGSKNAIAEWIVNELPPNRYFVDLFFGGGAITHAAMLSKKWDRFIINDIDEWAEKQDNIYISEYQMPDEFIEIARCEKTVLSAAGGNNMKAIEKLYTNKRTYNSMPDEQKEHCRWNVAEQLSF